MRRPLALLAALPLLLLSAATAALALAGIYREDAGAIADAWYYQEDGEGLPREAWARVRRYLELAGRLAPLDAQVRADLGALYEARVMGAAARTAATPDPAGDPGSGLPRAALSRSTAYRLALDHYRAALALQPTSAMAWGNIALLKVSSGDIDAEFARAMRQAMALAPWEPAVQASIAGGGLSVWGRLPNDLQTEIERAVLRGVAHDWRLMGFVVARFGLAAPPEGHPAQSGDQPGYPPLMED